MSARKPLIRRGFIAGLLVILLALGLLAGFVSYSQKKKAFRRASGTKDLRLIDAAIDQYAIEYGLKTNDSLTWTNVKLYLKPRPRYSTERTPQSAVEKPAGTDVAGKNEAEPGEALPQSSRGEKVDAVGIDQAPIPPEAGSSPITPQ